MTSNDSTHGETSAFARWYPEALAIVEAYAPNEWGLANLLARKFAEIEAAAIPPSPETEEAKAYPLPDWQREHDSLLENVVRICLESRQYPKDRQAAFLRDSLLTMCDPLMIVTQRLRDAASRSQEER